MEGEMREVKETYTVKALHRYAALYVMLNNNGSARKVSNSKNHHRECWRYSLNRLRDMGWKTYSEDCYRNGGQFSSLGKYNKSGVKNFCGFELRFRSEYYGTGFKFEFFQEHVTENSSGGYYDFDKYEKMPYLLKKAFELTTSKMVEFLADHLPGTYRVKLDGAKKESAERFIVDHCQEVTWHHENVESLDDIAGSMSDYDHGYNSKDRDGTKLECGRVKYFRDYNGRLSRGAAYHNINNMWWVITNNTTVRNVASFELFDATEEDFSARRLKKGKVPEKRVAQLKALEDMPVSDLRRELERRRNIHEQEAPK
jgi:hypothetical protein